MAFPGAWIYQIADTGLERIDYKDTEHYKITKSFLDNPERMFGELFRDDE